MKYFVLLLCVSWLLCSGAVSIPPASVNYTSVGCLKDRSWYPTVPSLEGQDPRLDGDYKLRENAIQKCAVVAKERRYKIFAIQDGGKCLGSAAAPHTTLKRAGGIKRCKQDGRGDHSINHFYVIGEMKDLYRAISYDSVGCYKYNPKMTVLEGDDPDVLDGNYTLREDAIDKCALAARKRGYDVFAVHDGGKCLVSDTMWPTFNTYGISQDCKSDGKGGPGASNVYSIGGIQAIMSRTEYGVKMGCYKDLPVRAMESLEGQDHVLDGNYKTRKDAIIKCRVVGLGRGYPVVGLQDGGMCVGSAKLRDFSKYGVSRDCKSDDKGGPWATEVQAVIGYIPDVLASVKYELLGCYKDKHESAIPSMENSDILLNDSYSQRNDPIQKCALAAKLRGYKTFAVQDGGMCVSGPTAHEAFDKYGESQDCKNDGKGGPWANQVYNLKGTLEDILSSSVHKYFRNKLGCFEDTQARTIPSLEGQDPVLDGNYTTRRDGIRKCAFAARRRGNQVFVVMADGQCASGPNTARNFVKFGNGGENECSKMDFRHDVYGFGHGEVDALLPFVEYESVGCYKDLNSKRAIDSVDGGSHYNFIPDHYIFFSWDKDNYKTRNQAIQKCALFAKLQEYKMFAVQDGGQCLTSRTAHLTYNKYGESQDCKIE